MPICLLPTAVGGLPGQARVKTGVGRGGVGVALATVFDAFGLFWCSQLVLWQLQGRGKRNGEKYFL